MYSGRTTTYNDDHVTSATVGDRVTAEYVLPHDKEGTPFEKYWNEDEWETKEATMYKHDGEYYLYIAVEKAIDPVLMSTRERSGSRRRFERGRILGRH